MDYLEALFDRALDAVVGMDEEGRVTAWNGAAEEIFGWDRETAIGASMDALIVPPQHREAHIRGLAHYNRTGEGPVLERRIRITALHRDGNEFPVELSIIPMRIPDRAPMFFAFIRSLVAEEKFDREQNRRASEAEAVMAIGQKLIEDVSLEEFIPFCLDQACKIAGMDAAHLFFTRGKGAARVLMPSGIWHLRDERFQPVVKETASSRFKPGEGLPGRAWQSGKLEALDSLETDDVFVRGKSFAAAGLTRGVALPVRHGGEVHAVLEFFGTRNSRLDPEVLRMLKTVGNQIGAAIRSKENAENRETLRREMAHRVSNSLAVLSSIYRSCSRAAATKEELDEAFLGRLVAMGRANTRAIVEAENSVELRDLIHDALEVLPDRQSCDIVACSLTIASDAVMPLSLVLSELATNTQKYGSLGSDSALRIHAEISGDELRITWQELRHEPLEVPPQQPARIGFGTQLMQLMVEGRLGGSVERRIDQTGFHFIMTLPLTQLIADAA